MSKLIITRGLPASGKSTWAKTWIGEDPAHRVRVNRDNLRFDLYGRYTDLAYEQEERITRLQRSRVLAALRVGHDVVVDDTHLRGLYVRQWERLARQEGAELVVLDFPIDVATAIARDAARARSVGAAAITHLADKFTDSGHLRPFASDLIGV